ncbi:MAG: DUF1127 domain-containing protein [Rhodospirillales bacterium]
MFDGTLVSETIRHEAKRPNTTLNAWGRLIAWGLRCGERMRQRRALAGLDARLLADVGLSREQVARECAKPFWR